MLSILGCNHNGSDNVNGRGLARRKLTLEQRISLGADLACGDCQLAPSLGQVATLLKVTAAELRAELKARARRKAEWLEADRWWRICEEAEELNAEVDVLVDAWRLVSTEARELAVRIIGIPEVWNVVADVAPPCQHYAEAYPTV
jgi:hypothetical protein